jgi:pentatricopeptide repeat protein
MWERGGRIEDAVKVFDEMLAAGEVKPTTVMYNALIGGRRGEGSGRHGPNAGRLWPSRRRKGVMAKRAGKRSGEAKAAVIAQRNRKEERRSGKAVGAGVTRRGFDVQHKTSGSGKPALMASQQVERTAELQDPEVRAELNRRVRECERKCFASIRLGSIQQACARARQ